MFGTVIHHDLTDLRDCISVVEDALERRRDALTLQSELEIAGITPIQQDAYIQLFVRDFDALSVTLPNIVRRSLFVDCDTLRGYWYSQVHRFIRNVHGRGFLPPVLCGKGKGASTGSTKNVMTIGVTSLPSWPEIEVYRRIRNVVVHAGRRLDPNEKETVERYMKAKPGLLTIDEDDRVLFGRSFCPEVIKTVREFFDELIQSLPNDGATGKGD